jgi:hypothetical protein
VNPLPEIRAHNTDGDSLTAGGGSTTRKPGVFRTERFWSYIVNDWRCQWDYRRSDGVLFSGISTDAAQARTDAERRSGERIQEP